jgi:hypothetical protein
VLFQRRKFGLGKNTDPCKCWSYGVETDEYVAAMRSAAGKIREGGTGE